MWNPSTRSKVAKLRTANSVCKVCIQEEQQLCVAALTTSTVLIFNLEDFSCSQSLEEVETPQRLLNSLFWDPANARIVACGRELHCFEVPLSSLNPRPPLTLVAPLPKPCCLVVHV